MHHTSVRQFFPKLPGRGGQHKTKLGEEGWRRIKILLFSGGYSGLQRVLQNFTEGYIIYINKVVISVCLFVCLSDHNSETPEPIQSE